MSPSVEIKHDPTHPLDNPAHIYNKVWRGDKEGKLRLGGIPKFMDPHAERQWIKEHMAAAFRLWGKRGYGEGIAGHITVRDPVLPDHYWMNPMTVHFSDITQSKLVLVTPDGHVSPDGAQYPINAAGFFIHSAIHKARPEIKAAAHCHAIHAKAWSIYGRPVDITTQDSCAFYENHAVYKNYGGVALAHEEGMNIARALGPRARTCLLQNHGLLTLGETVDEAVNLFVTLDIQCHIELLTHKLGKKTIIDKEDAEYTARVIQDPHNQYLEFQPEYQLIVEETNGEVLQ